jgi:hypothetical protein
MAQPHVILFEHPRFRGAHKHVFSEEPNLNDSLDDFFNDKTSSIVILEGDWVFFRDWKYENQLGGTLGPGSYKSVNHELEAGSDNQISSLCPVNFLGILESKRGTPMTK